MSEEPEEPENREKLRRMSFGDHLDELRRRLIIATTTLFVCVGVMLPFKDTLTAWYIGPYRLFWNDAYGDFLANKVDLEFANSLGPAEPQARLEAANFLGTELVAEVLGGSYAQPELLRTQAGFETAYPARDSPAWDAFATEFDVYQLDLNRKRDGIERKIWHDQRRVQVLSGDYPYPELIVTKGGFQLSYNLVALNPLEDFWTFMAAALLFACIVASPVLFWQIWSFIAAGLYKKERKIVYRTLPYSLFLLLAGVAFGYFVMVPQGFGFLAGLMDWAMVGPMFTVGMYFKFLLTLTFALGVVFQLPIAMVALQKVEILKFDTMRKNWRWVVMSFFLISAVLTPPDPVTQMLMVTPMLALFILGLLLMWRIEVKRRRAES